MGILFENSMFGFFAIAVFFWLLQIRNTEAAFPREEKAKAASFAAAFLLGIFEMVVESNKIGAIICSIGFLISEFTLAIVFYENFKDIEVPYE